MSKNVYLKKLANIGDFLIWPHLLKYLHKYYYKILDLFGDVTMGILIVVKTPKINGYKNATQFTKQL